MNVEECTLVIPALNEAAKIQYVLKAFAGWPRDRIVVVDNGSDDSTSSVAAEFGVVVMEEARRGKGFAVAKAAKAAETDYLFLCDADIKGISETSVLSLMSAWSECDVLARLWIMRPPEYSQVTHLTAKPLLAALGMDLVAEPIGGLALVSRQFLLRQHLHGGWGFDIDMTIAALEATGKIPELQMPEISERKKGTSAVEGMAADVLRAGLQTAGLIPWNHHDCTKCCT